MTIAELVAKISLKGGKESVATMKGLLNSTIATKAALLGAATALYKFSEVARQSALYMDMYQLNTGLSIEQLQKLSFRASQAGVSMQELGGTIQKLQQMNANARLGYGWDPILTRFGLTPGQDPVTQLDQISRALKRLGASHPAEAHALASKVGLSDTMYYALMNGTTEQMNKQLILSQKEQKSLVYLNQQWQKFWFYLKQVTIKITALGAAFNTRIVKVLTRAVEGFYELFSRIYKAIEASDKLKLAILAIGAVLAAVFAPELLVLGAIALVLEDIFGYFNGEDSVTGRIVEWCKQSKEFQEIWLGIKTVFDMVKGAFKAVGEVWKEVIYPMLSQLTDSKIYPFIEFIMKRMTNPLGSALEDIGKVRKFFDENKVDSPTMALQGAGGLQQTITNNNYIQGTGNAKDDAQYVSEFASGLEEAQAQQPSLANGSKNGGTRYH